MEGKFERIKTRVPERLHGALKDCVCRWHETMEPVAGAQEFVKYVQEKGYQTYILSNASTEFYLYFPRCYDMKSFQESSSLRIFIWSNRMPESTGIF